MDTALMRILMIVPLLLFSLTFHEFCHALVAYLMGDPTAKRFGRLTLDPLAHLDPLGTIMIILTMLTGFGIGWAKPVPVNFRNLRNLRLGVILVGLAGPAANFLLAVVFSIPLGLLVKGGGGDNPLVAPLVAAIVINIVLASFNLIPLPPLDGSRIVQGFLRGRLAYEYARLEQYGTFILLMLVLLRWTGPIILPVINVLGPAAMSLSGVSWLSVLYAYTYLF